MGCESTEKPLEIASQRKITFIFITICLSCLIFIDVQNNVIDCYKTIFEIIILFHNQFNNIWKKRALKTCLNPKYVKVPNI